MPAALLDLQGICRTYPMGMATRTVLKNVSLMVPQGDSCAIVGASGSGKSTLLNILGLLDRPDSGAFTLAGEDMLRLSGSARARVRNERIGFVFQSFNLLPRLDALDNVALPLQYRGIGQAQARKAALEELDAIGLAEWRHHRPAELSGGQRQRVAVARALATRPALMLADEPTGNLDNESAAIVLDLLLARNRDAGVTLLMVTHDQTLAARMQRCFRVEAGRLYEQTATA